MSSDGTFPVVIITGPVGVGKTTTAEALGELLIEHDIPHTMIDMDALTWTYPRPAGDRFNARLGLRNLADVTKNGRENGSTRLIVAGVIEARSDRDDYRNVIPGAEVTVVRLVAPIERIRKRIVLRSSSGAGSEAGVAWEKDRAAELIAIMDAADVADFSIETTDREPRDVAREIAEWLGWLPPNP